MNRRKLLQSCTAGVLSGLATRCVPLGGVLMPLMSAEVLSAAKVNGRRLVLVELSGANDGLNTIVPFNDNRYYELRPKIGLSRDKVIDLDQEFGIHQSMEPMLRSWENGDCAVIHGLGYPQPNRSHFASLRLWESGGDGLRGGRQGWVTKPLEQHYQSARTDAHGISFDGRMGVFSSPQGIWLSMSTASQFNLERMLKAESTNSGRSRARSSNAALELVLSGQRTLERARHSISAKVAASNLKVKIVGSSVASQLAHTANLINAGVDAPVFKVSLPGFDTHESQLWRHAELLERLAAALAQFRTALIESDEWDNTLVMTYSEFGRRAKENRSGGTDHGTAAPHFLLGGAVSGGLYGKHPDLGVLENFDLQHTMDYRAVYHTVLSDWFGTSDPAFSRYADDRLKGIVASQSV